MTKDYPLPTLKAIKELIHSCSPDSLLICTDSEAEAIALKKLLTEQPSETDPDSIETVNRKGIRQLATNRRDLAILITDTPQPDEQIADNIAALRDLYAQRFILLAPAEPAWNSQEMRAYGLATWNCGTDQLTSFHYNLENYKRTPDWLNNQYWANPERWDQERW